MINITPQRQICYGKSKYPKKNVKLIQKKKLAHMGVES